MAVGINPTISSPQPEETPLSSNPHTIPQKLHASFSQQSIPTQHQQHQQPRAREHHGCSSPLLNQPHRNEESKLIPSPPSDRSYVEIVKGISSKDEVSTMGLRNSQTLDMVSMALKPISVYQGKPAVVFPFSEKKSLVDKLSFVLVGKFSHGMPSLVKTRKFFNSLKLVSSCTVSVFDKKHIFIECSCKADFNLIWMQLTWVIDGFVMRVFRWTSDFHPVKESAIVPVWIRLEGLPLYMFDVMPLMSIANTIGKPLKVDPRNVARTMVNSARICVELDLSKPLVDSLWLSFEDEVSKEVKEGFWVMVYYDVVPGFCGFCSHIGHSAGKCKRKIEQALAMDATIVDADVQRIKTTQDKQNWVVPICKGNQSNSAVGTSPAQTGIEQKKQNDTQLQLVSRIEQELGDRLLHHPEAECLKDRTECCTESDREMVAIYQEQATRELHTSRGNAADKPDTAPVQVAGKTELLFPGAQEQAVGETTWRTAADPDTNADLETFEAAAAVEDTAADGGNIVCTRVDEKEQPVAEREPCAELSTAGYPPMVGQNSAEMGSGVEARTDSSEKGKNQIAGMLVYSTSIGTDLVEASIQTARDMVGQRQGHGKHSRFDAEMEEQKQDTIYSRSTYVASPSWADLAEAETGEKVDLPDVRGCLETVKQTVAGERTKLNVIAAGATTVVIKEEENSLQSEALSKELQQGNPQECLWPSKQQVEELTERMNRLRGKEPDRREELVDSGNNEKPGFWSVMEGYAMDEIEMIMTSPTRIGPVFARTVPTINNACILDLEGSPVRCSEVIRNSARIADVRKQFHFLSNEKIVATLVEQGKYKEVINDAMKTYTKEIHRTLLEQEKSIYPKHSNTEKATSMTQEAIPKVSTMDEKEWTTPKRRGRNRNRSK